MLCKILIGACAVGMLNAAPAVVADGSPDFESQASDFSAKKKQRAKVKAVRPAPPAYTRSWYFRDPSLGPDGRPYRNPYPPGTCTIDLGYGQFAPCEAERD